MCCVVDAGTFIPLADMMGRKAKKAYYYSPYEQEYLGIERCVIGDGFDTFERLDEFLDPNRLAEIDLFIFPDIGFGNLQRMLRDDMGKMVWGSMGASDLELYRTKFLKVLEDAGLPIVNSERVVGLTALGKMLKGVNDKWVKINRFRDNMETWHHSDYDHSERELERMALVFGPLKEHVVFVVQDAINGDDDSPVLEVGYDGWTVDGQFPESSFQGYEQKNELYLGSLMKYDEMPDHVRLVNEKMSGALADYGYRNFWATEIRIKDGTPYFIDPTARMAGQTMEHLLETCTNLPEVILAGASGELIVPQFQAKYAAEATLHYKTQNDCEAWKTLRVPENVLPWTKLYRCCFVDGSYQFPPHKSDELGVICGIGDSIENSIEHLMENFDSLESEPVCIESDGFADLLCQIKDAEKEGVEFSDAEIPEPEAVLGKATT